MYKRYTWSFKLFVYKNNITDLIKKKKPLWLTYVQVTEFKVYIYFLLNELDYFFSTLLIATLKQVLVYIFLMALTKNKIFARGV